MKIKTRHKKFVNIVCYCCFRYIYWQFALLQSNNWLDWVYQKEGTWYVSNHFVLQQIWKSQRLLWLIKVLVWEQKELLKEFCSKSVSAGWVHYDSVKKKCVCVTKAKRAAMQQCIFLNQTWEKRYCPRLKRYFFVIKGHCTGQRMI